MNIKPTKYKENDLLIDGIYAGVISINALPQSLFEFNFLNIMSGAVLGTENVSESALKLKSLQNYKKNLSLFSGAKTWHHVKELSGNVFDTAGKKIAFTEFKKIALQLNPVYNEIFLKTELNTSFAFTQGAKLWDGAEQSKNVLPLLQYQTTGDGKVRDEHAALDGIIKPVEDEFWSTNFPPNDWGCRCTVIQLEDGAETDLNEHLKEYNKSVPENKQVESLENKSKIFNVNPGKTKNIFPANHPYNDMPKEFKQAQKDNFDFKTPSDSDIIKFTKNID